MKTVYFSSLTSLFRAAGTLAVGLSAIAMAQAGPTSVSGKDAGATKDFAGSNSDAAEVTFTSDATAIPGTSSVITFDSGVSGGLALGGHAGTVDLGDGVSVAGTNVEGNVEILNNNDNNDPITGYNVTSGVTGGTGKYLYIASSNDTEALAETFTFAPGVQGFGSYFVGIGTADGTVDLHFNDGTSETYDLSSLIGSSNGGLGFFGFLDPSKDITSLSIIETPVAGATDDVFSMDNIQVVRATATPEPGIVVTGVSMLSMTGLGLVRGRRRANKQSAA